MLLFCPPEKVQLSNTRESAAPASPAASQSKLIEVVHQSNRSHCLLNGAGGHLLSGLHVIINNPKSSFSYQLAVLFLIPAMEGFVLAKPAALPIQVTQRKLR
ncbi:hypothetical protein AVEN_185502-1 [Araneus ventricosus]|uniref:Uncharacterized protein n=1 Tax=Araneus ventricosus TaxID=182803 RepID=A0A4Y2GBY4_ARAVE|nr:hypothetical protein AVEN_185502-1 [Araneus ventricosus]